MPQSFYHYIRPFLERFDPEKAHNLTVSTLHILEKIPGGLRLLRILAGTRLSLDDHRLAISFHGMTFSNPLMIAAGFDKNVECAKALHALGFGGVEVGGITLEPQAGHPKPRIFRVAPGVIINRCGFNNVGATIAERHLARYQNRTFPLGLNLSKNADISLEQAAEHFAVLLKQLELTADYHVINVSSPNTSGLRDLQQKEKLHDILQAVSFCSRPLFLKISPDLTLAALDDMIDLALSHKLAGIIAVNTMLDPTVKAQYGAVDLPGGVSGHNAMYRERATEFCRHIYRTSKGKLTIMAAGGVHDAHTTLEKIIAGASTVQIMSALSAHGPGLANSIKKDLILLMEKHKIGHILDCQGKDEYLSLLRP